jgi:hypothetical protein
LIDSLDGNEGLDGCTRRKVALEGSEEGEGGEESEGGEGGLVCRSGLEGSQQSKQENAHVPDVIDQFGAS